MGQQTLFFQDILQRLGFIQFLSLIFAVLSLKKPSLLGAGFSVGVTSGFTLKFCLRLVMFCLTSLVSSAPVSN